MELSIAHYGKKELITDYRNDKVLGPKVDKASWKPTKEAMTVNATPVKISTRGKAIQIEAFRDQEMRTCTLKELEEKTYPFPNSDVVVMLKDLLDKKVIDLLECKWPEEMNRTDSPRYSKQSQSNSTAGPGPVLTKLTTRHGPAQCHHHPNSFDAAGFPKPNNSHFCLPLLLGFGLTTTICSLSPYHSQLMELNDRSNCTFVHFKLESFGFNITTHLQPSRFEGSIATAGGCSKSSSSMVDSSSSSSTAAAIQALP
ncbi:hypothetical protein D8674_013683 [Pyrus ussuriensis x Pyrus communis]|uniref:Uncharacterized protein n=1 Tax=Pyrus ussuriensis x Pyrus communis TaxID=2448454 RepID=A0A5N5H3X1_9ROSA|nr:hypothetical protein D8674_013683 [Pyrus ussuriensis x Pyrus communis]